MGEGDLRGSSEDSGEGRDGGEGADREPEEERWREMEMGAEEERRQRARKTREREMDVREMGSVMIKGRDDGMKSKMGCGVREMEMVGGFCMSRRR